MPLDYKSAEDLGGYVRHLRDQHDQRDRLIRELRGMWESPIPTADSERTIYVNNEPRAATNMGVAYLTAGKVRFKFTVPTVDLMDHRAKQKVVSDAERFARAHWEQVDLRRQRQGKGRYRRALATYFYVDGWAAGINLVEDAPDHSDWPILSDLWSPLDTFRDPDDGDVIVHSMRMKWKDVKKFSAIKGGGWDVDKDDYKPDDRLDLSEVWTAEEHGIILFADGKPQWVKKLKEHGLEHNPAFCVPLNAAPFRESVTDEEGMVLSDGTDYESGRWLALSGQSPLVPMRGIHRALTEYFETIMEQVERWGSGKTLVRGKDGIVDIDLTRNDGELQYVGDNIVEVLKAPVFPGDQQKILEYLTNEMAKVSHSRVMYGLVGPTEAAITLDVLRETSNRILSPIIDEMEMVYTAGMDSILRQLGKKKQQFDKKFRVRSRDVKGKAVVDYVNLSELPDNVDVTVLLQGAGVNAPAAQRLQIAANVMNQRRRVASDEYIRDEVVGLDDPLGEEQKVFWEDLANNDGVKEAASPIVTSLEIAKRLKGRGEEGDLYAQLFEAVAKAGVDKLMKIVAPAPERPAAPPVDPAAAAAAAQMGAPAGAMQVEGVAAPGAPVAGTSLPPTGAAMGRGDEMAMAVAMAAEGGG